MAIENTYLLGKNITLGCGFDLQAKAPLDSRQTVPAFAGLQALIAGNAAYEGMIVYDEETKKTYQAKIIDDVLTFREFGMTEQELRDFITSETTAAMEFKGAAAALPTNPAKGDFYKVTAAFKVGEEDAKIGDSIVYDGANWFLIPSGDDIEDTWRPVTGVDNDATLTFAAGDKLEKTVAADGTITYKHVAVDAPELLAENEQTRTYITEVETDGFGHITGYKTATENVVDTNTTYTFEGQSDAATSVYLQVKSSDAEAAEVIYLDAYTIDQTDHEIADAIQSANIEAARLDEEVLNQAKIYADGKDAAIQAAKKAGDDAQADITAYKASNNEALAGVKATADAAAVKTEVETELAKKVDIVEGKDLIATSEIERLATLANYDDTQVKADIAKKADAEAMTTELGKKVDKVDGYSLVSDDEIARLADVDNYNDAEVRGLIGDNAKDIEDLEAYVGTFTHDTAKTVIEYINAKTDGIATSGNLEALGARVTAAEGKITALETESAKHATKDELNGVDKKFENYNTTAAQKAIDDAQDARIKAIEDDYLVEADIANFETKENVKKVSDELGAYKTSNDAALAAETKARTDADAGFETRIAALEGNFGDGEGTVEAQIAAAVKAEEDARKEAVKGVQDAVDAMYTNSKIDELVQGVKDYADENDTKYGIVYEDKKIKLVEGGSAVEIDATDFIKDGMIESVALSEDGLNLVITWNTDSGKGENNVTTIPLTGLVDVYTGVEGARINVAVSSDKKVSADIVAGSIGKNYLDSGVQASLAKADSALQTHQDISHLATTEALNGVDAKFANYTNTTDMNAKFDLKADKTQVAKDIEAAEAKVQALADGQVTTNKNDIASIIEMLTWGEF